LNGKFAGCIDVLRQPVARPLLVVAVYLFLAPNVDFAFHLDSHEGRQSSAQSLVDGVMVMPVSYDAPGPV